MGQNPEQEVRRAVPGLATPPPTGDPHPSGSNSPPLRCPRPPRRPDLLPRVPDRGQGGASQPPERVWKRHGVRGTTPRPSPLATPAFPQVRAPPTPEARARTRISLCPAAPPPARAEPRPPAWLLITQLLGAGRPLSAAARPPRGTQRRGPPAPANPRRGRPGAGQSGGAGGAEGQLHHPLTPAPSSWAQSPPRSRTCAFSPGPSAPKPSPPPPPRPHRDRA